MMIAACLERSLSQSATPTSQFEVLDSSRHPDAWAAYGRFIFFAISMRCAQRVQAIGRTLHFFRRSFLKKDTALVFAFRDRCPRDESHWATAEQALRTISTQCPVDHLNVFVAGTLPPQKTAHAETRVVLDGEFMACSFSYNTNDLLELAPTFDEFLMTLGRSNRRDMRRRRANALKAGLQFEISRDPSSISREECYRLGRFSRPCAFSRETIDAWDALAQSQPGFFHCALRDASGRLLSYCSAFAEADSAILMYQLNDKNFPDLALTMSLRGFMIEHCIEYGLRRMVLPMGISGHLNHAAGTNPVSEVLFVRRSLNSLAKAIVMRIFRPDSPQARMVRAPGFVQWALTGQNADSIL